MALSNALLAVLCAVVAGVALAGWWTYHRRTRAQERTIRRQMARESSLKARFDDLFDRAGDMMIVHDRRGRISTLNRAAEQASGYAREEVRVLDPSWLFSKPYIEAINRLIAEGPDSVPRVLRAELITRKGAKVPLEAHARVLVGDGQVVGVTVVARNMVERDQLEAQLRQAQKMEAVGRLATGIAHDFNNLITVLLGYSDELAESVAHDSPLRRPVEEMRRAVQRAAGLTQQLLSFSRRQTASPELIDPNESIANMRDLLKRLLGAEIRLEINLQPALGLVKVDRAQLGQVIINLAANARDAMPNGGTLSIRTARVELGAEHLDVIPGPHVLLEVRDTGVGMTTEVQRHLFEPFFTTKEAGEGTGLGLSMVNAIVRQSGGHITADSEPGKGSTFRLYFPWHEREVAEGAPAGESRDAAAIRGNGVVLLAEDDRAVRRLLSAELRRRGFTVLEARHGGEALEICRQYGGAIDALVTDVVMPTMNGADLAAAAKPLRPDMKILFISGHPERSGAGLEASGLRTATLLMKPFTPETLAARVHDMLSNRPS